MNMKKKTIKLGATALVLVITLAFSARELMRSNIPHVSEMSSLVLANVEALADSEYDTGYRGPIEMHDCSTITQQKERGICMSRQDIMCTPVSCQ